jgi:MFS family permease
MPLAIRPFRRVWAGTTISAAGDAAGWVALVALAVGPVHASLPLLAVLYTAPVAVGGLGAGWVLDRFDRRRVMVIDSVVRGVVFASIPITMAIGRLPVIQLYLVAVVYGLLKMTSLAGFPTLIPSLVPEEQLDQANALESAGFGLAGLVGAALAGVGVATLGAAPVVACDAASYFVMAAALGSTRGLRQERQTSGGSPNGAGHGRILRLVASNAALRSTTIMFACFNVGEGCLLVFLPRRAVDLGLGASGYGYLVAATTGGQILATMFLLRRGWRGSLRVSIAAAQLIAAGIVTALAVRSAVSTVGALVVLGMVSAPMTAWAQTLRMRLVPPENHGRLFATLRTTMQATPPAGAGLAALTLPHGEIATVLAMATVIGLPALLLAPGLLRSGGRAAPPGAITAAHTHDRMPTNPTMS